MIQRRKADQKKYEEEFDEGGEKEDVFIRVYWLIRVFVEKYQF